MSETNTITNSKKLSACYIKYIDNDEMMLMTVPGRFGYKLYGKRMQYVTICEKNSDVPSIVLIVGDEMELTEAEAIELAAATSMRHLEALNVSKIDGPNEET